MVAYEEKLCAGLFEAPDAKEGMQAFLQKRAPRFQAL
jgi:enoyl-CoA hydratase/carnithine racemase